MPPARRWQCQLNRKIPFQRKMAKAKPIMISPAHRPARFVEGERWNLMDSLLCVNY
jgi:hypothetical protein